MSDTNTGKQGGAPALPNNFQGQKPKDAKAPGGIEGNVDSENRGKDGTQK
jgi:hypothetical protein